MPEHSLTAIGNNKISSICRNSEFLAAKKAYENLLTQGETCVGERYGQLCHSAHQQGDQAQAQQDMRLFVELRARLHGPGSRRFYYVCLLLFQDANFHPMQCDEPCNDVEFLEVTLALIIGVFAGLSLSLALH